MSAANEWCIEEESELVSESNFVVCLDHKKARAESWLTEWADAQIRGVDSQLSGYSSKSNISLVMDQGFGVGGQCSKPLVKGRMGAGIASAVDRVLREGLSPRQRIACIAIFQPGDKPEKDRAKDSGYQIARYYEIKRKAIWFVMSGI